MPYAASNSRLCISVLSVFSVRHYPLLAQPNFQFSLFNFQFVNSVISVISVRDYKYPAQQKDSCQFVSFVFINYFLAFSVAYAFACLHRTWCLCQQAAMFGAA